MLLLHKTFVHNTSEVVNELYQRTKDIIESWHLAAFWNHHLTLLSVNCSLKETWKDIGIGNCLYVFNVIGTFAWQKLERAYSPANVNSAISWHWWVVASVASVMM